MGLARDPVSRVTRRTLTEHAPRRTVAVTLALLVMTAAWAACRAEARGSTRAAANAATGSARIARDLGTPRSPSEPAFSGSTGAAGTSAGTAEASATPSVPQPDPLAGNGLGSPVCGASTRAALSTAGQRSCETSGFVAAAYPTADYGVDVHIDTGVLGLSQGGFMSAVQDLLVTPVWMSLLWAVHAMVVMLEWGFTIDLLDGPAGNGLGAGLRRMQDEITDPILPLVLAVAAVLAAYQGIVRRRVSRAVGEVVLMTAMMAGGLWVAGNPVGTVGALGSWANQASLGALTVGARGTPAVSTGSLAGDMQGLFKSSVEAPWCYLEFGDVAWCEDASRLDPRLHTAGLHEASAELALAAKGGPDQGTLTRGAALMRAARTNGDVFLSLPANSPARNSITEGSSLLRAICQSSEVTSCQGPAALQAEFRTSTGTWPRVGGLVLIAVGLVGVLLVFGFVGLRLLMAATFSLLFLLLAPVAILAPAFGERGRAVFRSWGTQLLAAVLSKLIFAFLLGVLLAVFGVISSLPAVGWWTQWLLMSTFAWTVFMRRHQALRISGSVQMGGSRGSARLPSARRVRGALEIPRAALASARATGRQAADDAPLPRGTPKLTTLMAGGVTRRGGEPPPQESTGTRVNHEQAITQISQQLTAKQFQIERIRRAERLAIVAPNPRRASELASRGSRVESDIARHESDLLNARHLASNGRPLHTGGQQDPVGGSARSSRRGVRPNPDAPRESPVTLQGVGGVHAADWPRGPGGHDPAGGSERARSSDATGNEDLGTGSPEPPVPWWLDAEHDSAVMRDLREVEAGRKRNIGFGEE